MTGLPIPSIFVDPETDFWIRSRRGDPGYYGLSWMLSRIGSDVHALNLMCAALLAWGITFARASRCRGWHFCGRAISVIVVGMGYTRQSAAIGCAMLGLVALGDGRAEIRLLGIAGAMFHKTAVVLLPIAALSASHNRIWNFAGLASSPCLVAGCSSRTRAKLCRSITWCPTIGSRQRVRVYAWRWMSCQLAFSCFSATAFRGGRGAEAMDVARHYRASVRAVADRVADGGRPHGALLIPIQLFVFGRLTIWLRPFVAAHS